MPKPVIAVVPEPAKPELPKSEVFTKNSDPFTLNGRKYYWQIKVKIYDKTEGGTGVLELVDVITHKTLLIPEDYYEFSGNMNDVEMQNFFEHINNGFPDANFDGYQDLVIHNNESSGSGGYFTNVFLYNPQSKIFSLSETLSGGNVDIDKKEKTLTNSWRSGVDHMDATVYHFKNNGRITYTEIISYDRLESAYIKRTNKKMVATKIVGTKIDTIQW